MYREAMKLYKMGREGEYCLRYAGEQVYYFDKNEIYRSVSKEKAEKMQFLNRIGVNQRCYDIYDVMSEKPVRYFNKNIWRKATIFLEPNKSTIDDFEELLKTVQLQKHERPKGVNRFVTKIGRLSFGREPENLNPKTFDFITVDVNIVTSWETDRITYFKKNKKEITNMVIQKIQNSTYFKKYGIPINFLKISKIIFSEKRNLIHYIFELKEM